MAQIEQSDNKGKKKKGAQKKMAIHVDFTPMVDMNMLLITFFMLCTTMIKSQTLKIALPTNEKAETVEQAQTAGESDAITLLLDTERDDKTGEAVKDVVYYYFGAPKFDPATGKPLPNQLTQQVFATDSSTVKDGKKIAIARGIRDVLTKRNNEVLKSIDSLKTLWRDGKLAADKEENKRIYDEKAKAIRVQKDKKPPIVIIKATPNASWESVISALDEMNITEISKYQIDNIAHADSVLMGLAPATPMASAAK